MDMTPIKPKKTQIVVVGGGAGGLELVAKLGRALGRVDFDIILVDRQQTHIWKPLLHEVAAGSLDANLDEVGYRAHAQRWGYRFFDGALEGVDRAAREIVIAPIIEDGREIIGRHRIRYDYLVLAVGSVSNDFGTPGVARTLYLPRRAGRGRPFPAQAAQPVPARVARGRRRSGVGRDGRHRHRRRRCHRR